MLDDGLAVLREKHFKAGLEVSRVVKLLEDFVPDELHEVTVEFDVHRCEEPIEVAQLEEEVILASVEIKHQSNALHENLALLGCCLDKLDFVFELRAQVLLQPLTVLCNKIDVFKHLHRFRELISDVSEVLAV